MNKVDDCTEYTREIDRYLKEIACRRSLAKLKRLELRNAGDKEKKLLQEWVRDDSFLGTQATRHIEYKLGDPLISRDGKRAYEFLIEFDVNDPSIGIYYGVKGLILEGDLREQIDEFAKEFYGVSINEYKEFRKLPSGEESLHDIIAKHLNATFPGKDYFQRFRFTDNAYNNTFWPFWIAADPEEDIVWETARAVSIIKRVYKEKDGLWLLSDSACKISRDTRKKLDRIGEVMTESKKLLCKSPAIEKNNVREEYIKSIRFTNEAYNVILTKLGKASVRFERCISNLIGENMISESPLLEKGFVIGKSNHRNVARCLGLFWEKYGKEKREYKHRSLFFDDISSLFIKENIKPFNSKTLSNYCTPKEDEKDYQNKIKELKGLVE